MNEKQFVKEQPSTTLTEMMLAVVSALSPIIGVLLIGWLVCGCSSTDCGSKSMVMFVPDGALICDGEVTEISGVEDEVVEVDAGTWYLNVSKEEDEVSAEISQEEDGGSQLNIKLVTISENDDEVETQFVSSVIVISDSAKLDPSPFMIETSGSGQQLTKSIVNCVFYWEGVLNQLNDYTPLPHDGTVYLRGLQEEPTKECPNPEWTWTLGTSEQTASSHQKVLNFKLYNFEEGEIKIDYRSTFLSLEDTTQKAKIVIGRIGEQQSVTIDAAGNDPSVKITNGTKSIELATSDMPDGVNNIRVRTVSYKDADDQTQSFHVVADKDVDLGKIKGDTGDAAGFGTPTASATELEAEEQPNVSVSSSGPDTAKVFEFQFGIPRGADGEDGVGIGSVSQKSQSGKAHTIAVMSDEAVPQELGTFVVNDGTDGDDGNDASIQIATNAVTGGTRVTLTPYSGTTPGTAQTFTVLNGGNGKSVTSATAGTPVVEEETTKTPITFSTQDGAIGTVNVVAKNGSRSNPFPLTLQQDGVNKGTYDGSSAITANFTNRILAAGNNITLSIVGNTITISANAGSAPNKIIDYVYDVKYDTDDKYLKKLMAHVNLSIGTVTYGTNNAATAQDGVWEPFADGAQTTPLTQENQGT